MSNQTILVTGATGTQGSSVIHALLAAPSSPSLRILALTRDPSSSKSKALSALDPRITLIEGSPSSLDSIFASSSSSPPPTSIFLVTVHGPPGAEEESAYSLIDAALSHGVQHFVFTSADRGGAVLSNTNPSPVPHIATKFRIEQYLKARCAEEGSRMTWTILRPVTFMDNLTRDFAGKGFAAMWRQVGAKPVQLVSAGDIGVFAAKALLRPEQWGGKALGIAGDELNYEQALEVFKREIGTDMPTTFCAVGSVLKVAMKDIGLMFKWFEKDGYAVDIGEARRVYPDLMDFGTWLREKSEFRVLIEKK